MAGRVERKYPRVNVALQAELRCPNENYSRRAQTATVSAGGGYFELVQTLEPRSLLDVTLWLGDVKVQAWAEVVSYDRNVGNGIKFVRMAEKDRARLKEYVEQRLANCSPFERARRGGNS